MSGMYFTHSLVGAASSKLVLDRVEKKFTEREKRVLWVIGITASVLPDFDLIYSALNHMVNHRDFITHGIFIYLLMSIFLYFLSFIRDKEEFGRKFFKTLALVFLLGILAHFLMDFIVGGIVFFAPFSYKIVGFEMISQRGSGNWLLKYLDSIYMVLELFNLTFFLLLLKDKKYSFGKMIALSYVLMAIFAFLFINVVYF